MQQILGHNDTARLTLGFLSSEVGMPRPSLANLLGVNAGDIDAVIDGKEVDLHHKACKAIRGLAAMQSMLLSGYTPKGASAWMRHPCRTLSGRSPREVLNSGDPAAIAMVLRAAVARMST